MNGGGEEERRPLKGCGKGELSGLGAGSDIENEDPRESWVSGGVLFHRAGWVQAAFAWW